MFAWISSTCFKVWHSELRTVVLTSSDHLQTITTLHDKLFGPLGSFGARAIHFALEDVTGTESSKDVAERCAILLRCFL